MLVDDELIKKVRWALNQATSQWRMYSQFDTERRKDIELARDLEAITYQSVKQVTDTFDHFVFMNTRI